MGKRKGRQSETLIHANSNENEFRSKDLEEEDEEKSGFFACYLLTSLCPRYKGHTYIGFTVNPRRRIRQHNGEICSGAMRTKKKRPWEMVLCIYGFPTNVAALQFEWAWQHPVESLAVRKAAVDFKSLGGLANKIKLAYTMLTLPAWNNLNLNVNFFSTKYTKHYAGCPTLPSHMRVHIRSMDELPCYTEGYKEDEDDLFKFENDLCDDDDKAEPENTAGSRNLEVQIEDVTIPVLASADHHNNNEEEAICVSDTKIHERRLFSNVPERSLMDSDDDEEPGNAGGSHDLESKFEGVTIPILDSADHHEEDTICVSDTGYHERPLFINIPESSYMDSDYYFNVVSLMDDENGKRDKGGPGTKISGSSGPVEVIDVFSPSPEYRARSRRKKKGGLVVCPEIIDLTQSPICV